MAENLVKKKMSLKLLNLCKKEPNIWLHEDSRGAFQNVAKVANLNKLI